MKKFRDNVTTASLEVFICSPEAYKAAAGIHLFDASELQLRMAIETSAKGNFGKIFCHFSSVNMSYTIPAETLILLFDCAQDFESFTVRVIDPRGEE